MDINLDILQTLGISLLAYLIGLFLKERLYFLKKFFIPAPVIGGLIVSIIILILNKSLKLSLHFDDVLSNFFMNIFFTAIGLSCSFKQIKKSGILGLKFAFAIVLLLPLQNLIGVSLAQAIGINPLHGIAMGSTSMTGGVGSATSFGKIMQAYGAENSISIGVASASFGIMIGSLVAGPVIKRLIKKYNLKASDDFDIISSKKIRQIINQKTLMQGCLIIGLAASFGSVLNIFLRYSSINFPYYVGCQFAGLIVRNILDVFYKDFKMDSIEALGNISLNLFLSLSLINLNIGSILNLAGPMLIILIAQAIFISIYTSLVTFNLCGRNYDAAVITAGHIGVGLGQTPNAMANMESVIEENGDSKVAMFTVPLVLAIAVNLFNPIIISVFIDIFK